MLLSILIPTFNRSRDLANNLEKLSNAIRGGLMEAEIGIVVTDNCSTDATSEVVQAARTRFPSVQIEYFCQTENVGLEQNALTALKLSRSKFIMYLGDDDFLVPGHLERVRAELRECPELGCIIPGYRATVPQTGEVTEERDKDMPRRFFAPSFRSCFLNSWRGHQLSGLVFARDGLAEDYARRQVRNIYPFIFFVASTTLRKPCLHLPYPPVQVSEVAQVNKDWGYRDDGLIGDIFDNYRCLYPEKRNVWKRSLLELRLLEVQRWRYLIYGKAGRRSLLQAVARIVKGRNTSWITKALFPGVLLPWICLRASVRAILRQVAG